MRNKKKLKKSNIKTDEELTHKELDEKYAFAKAVWEKGIGYSSGGPLCPF